MDLDEVFTEDQYEERVRSWISEMRDLHPVAFGLGDAGFSAIVDCPVAPGEATLAQVGSWESEADAILGRDPLWTVAVLPAANFDDAKLSLGLNRGRPGSADAVERHGVVVCDDLPGASESRVYRDASGLLFSEHIGNELAVILVGQSVPSSPRLHRYDVAGVDRLIENWGKIARGVRRVHA